MDRRSQLDEDDEEDEEDEEERTRRRRRRRRQAAGGRRQEEEEEKATDIKSNNPHLAGGEQKNYSTSCDPHHDIYTFSYWQILRHSI